MVLLLVQKLQIVIIWVQIIALTVYVCLMFIYPMPVSPQAYLRIRCPDFSDVMLRGL